VNPIAVVSQAAGIERVVVRNGSVSAEEHVGAIDSDGVPRLTPARDTIGKVAVRVPRHLVREFVILLGRPSILRSPLEVHSSCCRHVLRQVERQSTGEEGLGEG
jgi:hypothetical protein